MHQSGPVAGFKPDNATAVANRDLNFNLVILSNTCYVDWCHKFCISQGFCLVGMLGCTSTENIKFNILRDGMAYIYFIMTMQKCNVKVKKLIPIENIALTVTCVINSVV
jgi:hypothetical protein